MSLNFLLRSSSAFRLARLRTGSHLVIDSRTPFASGGSVLLINIGCCLLISRPCYRRHSRFVAGELVAHRKEGTNLAILGFFRRRSAQTIGILSGLRGSAELGDSRNRKAD